VDEDTCTVAVTFTPTAASQYNGTLTIAFTDPTIPDAVVTLTGKGKDSGGGGGGGGGGGCFISSTAFPSYLTDH
jgi:hypothetical protein